MKVSIIVPFYNKWELVHARLYEFYKHLANSDFEVCLINDASTEDVSNAISFWQKGAANYTILYRKNEQNLGFGGAHNEGAKIATGDIFVFYSNDVVLSGNFIPQLVETFEREGDRTLVGNRCIWFPAGWNEFEVDRRKRVVPYLEGFFIASTRVGWKGLGGWDTDYGKYDYEDVDLSTQAASLGYNLVDLKSPFLRHIGGVTISSLGADRRKQTEKNRELYIQKWQKFLSEE